MDEGRHCKDFPFKQSCIGRRIRAAKMKVHSEYTGIDPIL